MSFRHPDSANPAVSFWKTRMADRIPAGRKTIGLQRSRVPIVAVSHSFLVCGMEQLVARRAHNPEAPGSSPGPATFTFSVKPDGWFAETPEWPSDSRYKPEHPSKTVLEPKSLRLSAETDENRRRNARQHRQHTVNRACRMSSIQLADTRVGLGPPSTGCKARRRPDNMGPKLRLVGATRSRRQGSA